MVRDAAAAWIGDIIAEGLKIARIGRNSREFHESITAEVVRLAQNRGAALIAAPWRNNPNSLIPDRSPDR